MQFARCSNTKFLVFTWLFAQIKDFSLPTLAAMCAAHQAKCFINTSAVHRPKSVWPREHVSTEDIGFTHTPATDTDGVPKDMNR